MNNEFNNQNNEFNAENNNYVNNQNNNKGKNGLTIVFIIIIIALVGLCIYLMLDKKDSDINNNNENNQQENENSNLKDDSLVEVDINEAKLALDNLNKMYIDKEKLYNSNFEIENITKKEIIGIAVANLDSKLVGFAGEDSIDSATNISVQDLKNILSKLIETEIEINIDDIKALCTNQDDLCGDRIVKVEDNNVKVYDYPHGMSFDMEPYDKFIKAEKNNENLYVYMKTAFRKFSLTNIDRMTYTYYKDYSGREMIEQIFEDEEKEPNWNLYNTYKYTFKIKNSNYYFEKSELLS